ncbi:methylmalonyl-CoA mutase subunit beta [Micromonospora sp. CPCC 206061]|uniref:methylmalonyl-CoA mutase subunit beta n=1 Tax=Micromonospora sp. CPCC 206061 TaxID=3122410 RepID=UPI002FEE8406
MATPVMAAPEDTAAGDEQAGGEERWRELAVRVLRKSGGAGADPDALLARLATTTYDGVRVAPLYRDAEGLPPTGLPGQHPFTRGGRPPGSGRWDVRARHDDPDLDATRDAIREDLAGGATSLWLVLGESGIPVDALPELLAAVPLDRIPVVLDAGAATPRALRSDLAAGSSLGADPLGVLARTGTLPPLDEAAELAARCAPRPGVRAITVDATPYHDAGGSDAEELGCALATGVAYLRVLDAHGLDTAAALSQLEFRYAVSADQFLAVAKLRAARRCWARIAEVYGAPPAARAQRQHAVTSSAMVTTRDPWVNALRGILAAFGAGVGGAEAVTVQPYDAALGLPDPLARRIARTTQLVLLDEAQAGRVADPAGGSWYVEHLTEELARAAWAWFREIERAGGIPAALHSGFIADRVAATWSVRASNIAHRHDPITGVSEYPDLAEPALARRPRSKQTSGGLPRVRYAEGFETLRDRADAHPARPTVFLATIGPASAYAARTAFAANLFAAGGIATVIGAPSEFAASGARVACLCGSDDGYAEHATAAAKELVGAVRVWLAGRPAGHLGADAYLYAGCDAAGVLETTLDDLGVA